MGTNFYAVKIITDKELNDAKRRLEEYFNGEISKSDFEEYLDELHPRIHLGKRSGGWQFHWESQPDYYAESLKSIKAFLSDPEWEIIDEYNEKFTVDEFFNNEIGDCLYNDPDKYINGDQYHRTHPLSLHDPNFEHTSKDGLRFSSTWFR